MENIKRALVVDDNVALARVTQFALDGAGFETQTAYNGRQALEAALETPFDVIVTDHQMPEMTGIELCRALRARPEYASRPLVLLTAKGLELELPRLRDELGIDATFAKPFSPSALAKAVVELVAADASSSVAPSAELVVG
jgi:two-component system, chemotaxis family, chemotaxis protein CheY